MNAPQQVEEWAEMDPPDHPRFDDLDRSGMVLVCADCGPDRCECGSSSGGVWV